MIYLTKNPKETRELADFLLKKFLKVKRKKAAVIALEGELGAGKTVFVRGLARALGIKVKIKSPTFTLMKSYKLQAASYKFMHHLDCYRLRDYRDLKVLGIEEILNNSSNIVVIEWSDRVEEILPEKCLKIHIDHVSQSERKILKT